MFEPDVEEVCEALEKSKAADCKRFAVRTLVTWIRNFAWSARETLGIDVLLRTGGPLEDTAAETLADFLWSLGRSTETVRGGDYASS
jgi:hypothetical protein